MKLYASRRDFYTAPEPGDAQPMSEMNTTPLIDVMLVLLVMLIITIPVQLHSLSLDMPNAQTAPQTQPVQLRIDAQGALLWNESPVSQADLLDARLNDALAQNPQPEIHIKPDPLVPYASVVNLLAQVQKAGLQRVGIAP